jgi:hypothetical protein
MAMVEAIITFLANSSRNALSKHQTCVRVVASTTLLTNRRLLSRARDKNAFSQLGACSQLSRLAPSIIECRTEHQHKNPLLLTGRQGLNSCPGGKTRDRDRMRLQAWNKPRRGGQINELGGGPALGCHRRRRRPVLYHPWSVCRKQRGLEGGCVAHS